MIQLYSWRIIPRSSHPSLPGSFTSNESKAKTKNYKNMIRTCNSNFFSLFRWQDTEGGIFKYNRKRWRCLVHFVLSSQVIIFSHWIMVHRTRKGKVTVRVDVIFTFICCFIIFECFKDISFPHFWIWTSHFLTSAKFLRLKHVCLFIFPSTQGLTWNIHWLLLVAAIRINMLVKYSLERENVCLYVERFITEENLLSSPWWLSQIFRFLEQCLILKLQGNGGVQSVRWI